MTDDFWTNFAIIIMIAPIVLGITGAVLLWFAEKLTELSHTTKEDWLLFAGFLVVCLVIAGVATQ